MVALPGLSTAVMSFANILSCLSYGSFYNMIQRKDARAIS